MLKPHIRIPDTHLEKKNLHILKLRPDEFRLLINVNRIDGCCDEFVLDSFDKHTRRHADGWMALV